MSEETKQQQQEAVPLADSTETQNPTKPTHSNYPRIIYLPDNEGLLPTKPSNIPKKQIEDEVIDMEFLAQLPKTEITKDGGVIKYLVTEGSFGEDEKLFDIYCRVRIKLELRREDGKIITGQQERNNTKTVNLYESNCHPGIIPAIFSMKPGEISWFRFSEEYYNATVYQDVPPGSKLYFR
eukprot:CAMPEP_0176424096 /NCGR_PEP_ID=MMETSP0127-20121128/10652_1 /TAXON_ID=938130 /ORGANISM="Platyophrya macrostoma, Strain WH" /LENGTH=180 /DNA_ID=CAMNT_0017805125 /DNA_START=21 /DNA_END=559 /DNA_ORIENTATION=+